ncbi:helix-turn-helix domain-containing protein, partial [Nocardiopsis tropica]|nr:helix-turn-helix domain-containing protein [Nocardiopsis tropica]
RSALVETALAVLERGSVSEAAHALYCHRNTVLNRLRRFEELTGRNPARPGDGALVLLSLEAARGRGAKVLQLTSDSTRGDAHRFYAGLGYAASHVGFKTRLA